MGCCSSSPEDREAKKKNDEIDKQLKLEAKNKDHAIKLLLLGSGESGKSTILKQFNILHGVGFNEQQRLAFRPAIINNLIGAIKAIVEAMEMLSLQYKAADSQRNADIVKAAPSSYGEGETMPAELVTAILALWKDAGIQQCYTRASEYQLIDSAKYFLDAVNRIAKKDFCPTEQDVLRARVMTTTITENKFKIEGVVFKIFDVGGQRSERKKWAPYFDDVSAIIFLAALSAYDQSCFEDNTTNRMVESMNLFESICNHPLFRRTAMILFLNKIDLFREKVKTVSIKKFFPAYDAPNEFEPGIDFFAHKFVALNKYQDKKIYVHFTWATDTTQIKTVFATVNAIILKLNLEASGI